MCSLRSHATYFAKNSDRPIGEAQLLRWFAARPASSRHVHSQYLDLGADPGSFGFLGSQPAWLWGVEHGVNECGVAIGNEKIWTTTDPRAKPAALLGMDIVRLALERARSADDARHIVCDLVSRYGQGGSGEQHNHEPYDSSFLIVDAQCAWVVETNHQDWAARRITDHVAISNRISLAQDWDLCSIADRRASRLDIQSWRSPKFATAHADNRLRVTNAAAGVATTAAQFAGALRDHGGNSWGSPTQPHDTVVPIPTTVGADSEGVTVCMHVRDFQTTAASMIVEFPSRSLNTRRATDDTQVWAALGSPCISIYVPVIPALVPAILGHEAVWTAFDALRVIAEDSPAVAAAIRASWAPLEARWWQAAAAQRDTFGTAWQPDTADILNAFQTVFDRFEVGHGVELPLNGGEDSQLRR